jgi:hypothetical protein
VPMPATTAVICRVWSSPRMGAKSLRAIWNGDVRVWDALTLRELAERRRTDITELGSVASRFSPAHKSSCQ